MKSPFGNNVMKLLLSTLLLLAVQAKDKMVVTNVQPHREHAFVRTSLQEKEECLFQIKKPKVYAYDQDEYDQLCMKYKGGWSVGF